MSQLCTTLSISQIQIHSIPTLPTHMVCWSWSADKLDLLSSDVTYLLSGCLILFCLMEQRYCKELTTLSCLRLAFWTLSWYFFSHMFWISFFLSALPATLSWDIFLFGSNNSLFLFHYSSFHLSCYSILYTHTVYLTSKSESISFN